jgi:hypothetical protein
MIHIMTTTIQYATRTYIHLGRFDLKKKKDTEGKANNARKNGLEEKKTGDEEKDIPESSRELLICLTTATRAGHVGIEIRVVGKRACEYDVTTTIPP